MRASHAPRENNHCLTAALQNYYNIVYRIDGEKANPVRSIKNKSATHVLLRRSGLIIHAETRRIQWKCACKYCCFNKYSILVCVPCLYCIYICIILHYNNNILHCDGARRSFADRCRFVGPPVAIYTSSPRPSAGSFG